MTQEIIEMAREAGFQVDDYGKQFQPTFISWGGYSCQKELEAFAKLVTEAERERIKQANAPEIEKINAHIQKAMTDLEEVLAEHAMCKVQRLGQEIEQEPQDWKTPPKEDAPLVKWAKEQTTPPQRTEQNFCSRCGKRTNDIHTCTPPKENT